MRISTQEELLQLTEKSSQVIIYGKASLIRIILRLMEKAGDKGKVFGVCVTEKTSQKQLMGIPVQSLKKMSDGRESAQVLVAVTSKKKEKAALRKLNCKEYRKTACVDYQLLADLGKKEHVSLDFVCVGFVKCGTTSLQAALIKNPDIYLPKKKETLYMGWRNRYDDSPSRFNQIYYSDVKENQTVGNIEPSYHGNAEGVYECFGKDAKIIFMVRNPVDATYSYFKMLMRKTDEIQQVNYYKKYHKFDVRMFDNYISDYILSGKENRFCYMNWIKRYLRFYDRDHIMVVFFDDLIQNPEQTLDRIQDFIGVKKMAFPKLPHSNEGKTVSKNYLGARINRWIYKKDRELRVSISAEEKAMHEKRKKNLQKYTLVENHDKMLPESRKVLNEFYMDSVHELEEFCGRKLDGIWY